MIKTLVDYMKDESPMSDLYIELSKNYLRNSFLLIDDNFIFQILKEFKNHLAPAYFKLTGLQRSKDGRLTLAAHCLLDVRVQLKLRENDQGFAMEKQCIENEISMQKRDRLKSIERKNDLMRRACAGKEIVVCVCAEEFNPADVFYCPDKHGFCKGCIKENIDLAKQHGTPLWACLQANCKREFEDAELRRILPADYVQDLYKARYQWEARRALHNNFQQCPDCKWGCHVDDENITVFYCMKCRKTFCTICGKLSHGAEMCPIKKKEREESREALDRYVAGKVDSLVIKACPGCHTQGVLEKNCNFITCRCGKGYCYYCGVQLEHSQHSRNAPHYNKSINPSACPLWGGIDQAKIDEVKKAAAAEWRTQHPNFKDLETKI